MRLAKAKGRFLNTNVKAPRATLQSSYYSVPPGYRRQPPSKRPKLEPFNRHH